MIRRPLVVSHLLVLSIVLCGCAFDQFKATRQANQSIAHQAGAGVEVITTNGSVSIVGDPSLSEVAIEVTLTCRGMTQQEADDRLAQTIVSAARSADGTLAVRPVFPGGTPRSGDGASFVIRLPDVSGVIVRTGNGTVDAKNSTGPLDVETSNGDVRVMNHDGDARLDTSNGGVTVDGLTGALTADSSNGNIFVTLDDANEGPIDLDTSNGNVVVSVGPSFLGHVEFDTSNGAVTVIDPASIADVSNLTRKGGSARVGSSDAPASRIDTSNGNITLTVREG